MVRLKDALEQINGVKVGGGSANNTEIESDGTMKFNGEATVFEDEYASYFFTAVGTPAPDIVPLNGDNKCYGFDGSATAEYLYANIELPHSYKEGSDIEVHLHHARVSSAATGNVKWFVDYTICPVIGAIVPMQSASVVKEVPAQNNTDVVTLVIIPGEGRKISDVISFRILRNPTDVADTFNADILLLSFGIHYERDTVGSRQRYIK
jgi:hypothetical protein